MAENEKTLRERIMDLEACRWLRESGRHTVTYEVKTILRDLSARLDAQDRAIAALRKHSHHEFSGQGAVSEPIYPQTAEMPANPQIRGDAVVGARAKETEEQKRLRMDMQWHAANKRDEERHRAASEHLRGTSLATPSAPQAQVPDDAPQCSCCGRPLTLVRPGKHQCDNPKCGSEDVPEQVPEWANRVPTDEDERHDCPKCGEHGAVGYMVDSARGNIRHWCCIHNCPELETLYCGWHHRPQADEAGKVDTYLENLVHLLECTPLKRDSDAPTSLAIMDGTAVSYTGYQCKALAAAIRTILAEQEQAAERLRVALHDAAAVRRDRDRLAKELEGVKGKEPVRVTLVDANRKVLGAFDGYITSRDMPALIEALNKLARPAISQEDRETLERLRELAYMTGLSFETSGNKRVSMRDVLVAIDRVLEVKR